MKINSVYIHVPFCLRKCNYCDFASVPVASCPELLADYPSLLRRELELWGEEGDLTQLRTVYLGGGTPSLLSPQQVGEIISMFPAVEETTLEANPETLDAEKLAGFRDAGVDRLSLGVQSFDAELLARTCRGHSPQQAADAVRLARIAGFSNISLDLIYGLPGQSVSQWQQSLQRAVELEVEHISLYGLTVHEDTPWGRELAAGRLELPDEDLTADMLELAMDFLPEQGWEQYEIANFAKPGFVSRHNCAYWTRENYMGLGAGAASCLANHRFANTGDPVLYAEYIRAGRLPWVEDEVYDIDQVLGEAMFLGLRLRSGIDRAAFKERYGLDPARRFAASLIKLAGEDLVKVDKQSIRLTDRGLRLGNLVFEEFV